MRIRDKFSTVEHNEISRRQGLMARYFFLLTVLVLFGSVFLTACREADVPQPSTAAVTEVSSSDTALPGTDETGRSETLSDTAAVPSVVGDTVEEACRKLTEAGLADPMIRRIYDEETPKGCVCSQNAEPGTVLGRGSVITLTVSRGPEPYTLPDMTHWEAAAAKAVLDLKGIHVTIDYVNDPEISEDVVLAQDIPAGTVLYKGDVLRLTVSAGKPVREVAAVTGLTKEQAEEKLLAQGFTLAVQEEYDENVPAGSVVAQIPPAGSTEPEGTSVTLIVSRGKAPAEPTQPRPTQPTQPQPTPTQPTQPQPTPTQPSQTQPTQPVPTTTAVPPTTTAVPPTTPETTAPPQTEPPAPETTEAASETQPIPDETTAAEETTEAQTTEATTAETTTAEPTPETTQREYIVYHFRNSKLLNDHYKKHGVEMGFKSAADYEKAACDVINNPNALSKREKEDNDWVFYIVATNEFVVLSTDGYIRTYFLPSSGKAYYDRQ